MAPLFRSGGEFSATGNLSFAAFASASAAYAITDNFSVMAAVQVDPAFREQAPAWDGERASYLADVGIGSQYSFSDEIVGDLFLGYGRGATRSSASTNFSRLEYLERRSQFQQYWAQASIGRKLEDMDLIYQLRATNILFDDFHEVKLVGHPDSSRMITSRKDSHVAYPIMDHSFITRVGSDQLRVFCYLTIGHALSSEERLHTPVNLGFGLELRIQ